ncbi:hypothetical protein AUR64_04085 [Haloprofundus marisrubri]|uniref:Uncharacterized protein n=1 Tax=Haloprofundus marisrubri TaxID=1514971 RepID=A0A0W1RDG5_9EURY|nr:hypothetical protein AUR64_04085 [Haloprofundus marisrubri]
MVNARRQLTVYLCLFDSHIDWIIVFERFTDGFDAELVILSDNPHGQDSLLTDVAFDVGHKLLAVQLRSLNHRVLFERSRVQLAQVRLDAVVVDCEESNARRVILLRP